MTCIQLVKHAPGAPGLRFLGLGPGLTPSQGLLKLKILFEKHAFWARGRSNKEIRQLLAGSNVIISLWRGKRLIGFGRATSDGIYRAVLWDIVVAGDLQGLGLGKLVVNALLATKALKGVERIYLMTTNSVEFYQQLNFLESSTQKLLMRTNSQSQ